MFELSQFQMLFLNNPLCLCLNLINTQTLSGTFSVFNFYICSPPQLPSCFRPKPTSRLSQRPLDPLCIIYFGHINYGSWRPKEDYFLSSLRLLEFPLNNHLTTLPNQDQFTSDVLARDSEQWPVGTGDSEHRRSTECCRTDPNHPDGNATLSDG